LGNWNNFGGTALGELYAAARDIGRPRDGFGEGWRMAKDSTVKQTKSGDKKTVSPETSTDMKPATPAVPMQDLLGDKLRAYYDEVAKEPVPDRFEQLLKQLEASSSSKKPS
jgi:hypothetical protein